MKTLHTKEDFYILYADDLQMEIQIKGSESGNTIAVIPNVKEYESMGEAIVSNPETRLANAKLFFAAKDMLEACRSALADLEGIMPVHDPNGDRLHPAWKTIE